MSLHALNYLVKQAQVEISVDKALKIPILEPDDRVCSNLDQNETEKSDTNYPSPITVSECVFGKFCHHFLVYVF